MMKLFTLFSLLFSVSSIAAEEQNQWIACPLYYLKEVKKTVESHGDYDKYKHCAVSCMLTLRCSPADVMEIGLYKEIVDVFGPGNAEIADLRADSQGIRLALSRSINTDQQCIESCQKTFPQ